MEMLKKLKPKKQKDPDSEKIENGSDESLKSLPECPEEPLDSVPVETKSSSLPDMSTLNPSAEEKTQESNIVPEDNPPDEVASPILNLPPTKLAHLTPDVVPLSPESFYTPGSNVANLKEKIGDTKSQGNVQEITGKELSNEGKKREDAEEIITPKTESAENTSIYVTPEMSNSSRVVRSSEKSELLSLDTTCVKYQEKTSGDQYLETIMSSPNAETNRDTSDIGDGVENLQTKSESMESERKESGFLRKLQNDANITQTTGEGTASSSDRVQSYDQNRAKVKTRDVGTQTDMVFIARPIRTLDIRGSKMATNEGASTSGGVENHNWTQNFGNYLRIKVPQERIDPEEAPKASGDVEAAAAELGSQELQNVENPSKPPVHVMRLLDAVGPLLAAMTAIRYSSYRAKKQLKWLGRRVPALLKEILRELQTKDPNDEGEERPWDVKLRNSKIHTLSDEVEDEIASLVLNVKNNRPEVARNLIQKLYEQMRDFYIEAVDILRDCKYVLKNYHRILYRYDPEENLLRIRIKEDFEYLLNQLRINIEEYILVRERMIYCSAKYLNKQLAMRHIFDTPGGAPLRIVRKVPTMPISVNIFRRVSAAIRYAVDEVGFRIDKRF